MFKQEIWADNKFRTYLNFNEKFKCYYLIEGEGKQYGGDGGKGGQGG